MYFVLAWVVCCCVRCSSTEYLVVYRGSRALPTSALALDSANEDVEARTEVQIPNTVRVSTAKATRTAGVRARVPKQPPTVVNATEADTPRDKSNARAHTPSPDFPPGPGNKQQRHHDDEKASIFFFCVLPSLSSFFSNRTLRLPPAAPSFPPLPPPGAFLLLDISLHGLVFPAEK